MPRAVSSPRTMPSPSFPPGHEGLLSFLGQGVVFFQRPRERLRRSRRSLRMAKSLRQMYPTTRTYLLRPNNRRIDSVAPINVP
jgi:hypothetical protein